MFRRSIGLVSRFLGAVAMRAIGAFWLFMAVAVVQAKPPRTGWLEGTVLSQKGDLAWDWPETHGAVVTLRLRGHKPIVTHTDTSKSGYYTFRDLAPGSYELFVDRSYVMIDGKWVEHRPIHAFQVVVRQHERTVYNVHAEQGAKLLEIGKPKVRTRVLSP